MTIFEEIVFGDRFFLHFLISPFGLVNIRIDLWEFLIIILNRFNPVKIRAEELLLAGIAE